MHDVIIAAFNAGETIANSVRSAMTVSHARVTVVDDGSTDGTARAARAAGARVIQQENAGAAKARTRGFQETTSPFVTFLDADDELVSEGVVASRTLLEARPRAAAVAGRVIGVTPRAERMLPAPRSFESAARLISLGRGPWPPSAAVIRRSSLEAARSLTVPELSPRYAEDYEMFIRLSLVGDLITHDVVATRYSLFIGKSSASAKKALTDKERIRTHYAKALNLPFTPMSRRELAAATHMKSFRAAVATGDLAVAGINLVAMMLHPDHVLVKARARFARRATGRP